MKTLQSFMWRRFERQARQQTHQGDRQTVHCRQAIPFEGKRAGRARSTMFFLVTIVSVTSIVGQRFYNQPRLDVDTVALQTLYAPEDATVPNETQTEERRKRAKLGAEPVLTLDTRVNQEIRNNLERYLAHGSDLRTLLTPFPPVPTSEISTEVQLYIRRLPEQEWLDLLGQVRRQTALAKTPIAITGSTRPELRALAELLSYRQRKPDQFDTRLKQLNTMRWNYRQAVQQLRDPALFELNAVYDEDLFDLDELAWSETQLNSRRALSNLLTQGIAPGVPQDGIDRAVRLHVSLVTDESARTERLLASRILSKVVKANFKKDAIRTQQNVEQAAQDVEPVLISIRKGEPIVTAGEEITADQLVLLDRFDLSNRRQNWAGLLGLGGFITLEVFIFALVQRKCFPRMRQRDWLVILLLSVSTPSLFLLGLPISSLPAVGLLVGSFYGSPLGLTTVSLITAALPIGLEIELQMLLASAAGGLMAAAIAGRLRAREELAILGIGVGLTQGLIHLVIALIASGSTGLIWYLFLQKATLYALRGVAWSIVALGVSPYLERLFDLITPIRLAELSNLNRPLLQRLASETPGTFQHTLFVASLAEAAARALGCNVELVRAGTLYHDIGKMHDPQSFIENQMGGPNKHDLIDDPWESAAIIRKHVTAGMTMARRCRLPRALQAFIPEHQGTMQISYFYHQAKKQAEAEPDRYSVNDADFRYAGPIPQSRETGIVMLADSCEAALRSLKDATTEEALTMVKKIMRARWQDNQLVDSGLSREDLNIIADVFVQIWQQFHHKRIPYPGAPRPIAFPPPHPLGKAD